MAGSILGTRVQRKEDPKFLTTGGVYVDDLLETNAFRMQPGAANGYVLTSNSGGDASWQPIAAGADGVRLMKTMLVRTLAGVNWMPGTVLRPSARCRALA